MDHKNFKKTITLLNDKISNMKLDMFGDDIIIDLSDLIETKGKTLYNIEQYIEESQSLLNSLNLLADQKLHKVEAHKDKNQKMVWPDLWSIDFIGLLLYSTYIIKNIRDYNWRNNDGYYVCFRCS